MSGLFGVVSKSNCAATLFYGTDYHSHMGTEYGGISVLGEKFQRSIHDISQSQFKSKFADEYRQMKGNMGIGVISDRDPQPLIIGSKWGTFAIVTAGLIENLDSLSAELLREGHSFGEMSSGGVNSVELAAKLINRAKDIVDGIEKMYDKIKGSASLLLMTETGVYAARDRLGRTPLVVGEKGGDFAMATETCSFLNLGFKIIKYLEPGETVFLGRDGLKQKMAGKSASQICAFLWVYTGYPASSYEGISVEVVREN